MKTQQKFQPGDKAKVKAFWYHSFKDGEEVEIIASNSKNERLYRCRNSAGNFDWVKDNHLSPLTPTVQQ